MGMSFARSGLAAAVLSLAVSGCGSDEPSGPTPPERPPPLAPLPPPASVLSGRFADSLRCAQCHEAVDDDPEAVRDPMGRDISPVTLWRPSMMAMAARDPYFLAAWSEERSRYPDAVQAIDRTCSRCHAPMGAIESEDSLTFEDIVAGDSDIAKLSRDGVSCAACHQIRPDNLGDEDSFTGGYEIGFSRQMFGPHADPNVGPMQFFLDFTPTESEHILSSELCATCHTVIVQPLDEDGTPRGIELVEQATYFEWQNSVYADAQSEFALTCAGCHLPLSDQDDVMINAPIATNPDDLRAREPFGRHLFVGGGAYMSRLLAANRDWAGLTDGADEDFDAAIAASETHLATAAVISVASAARDAQTATVSIRVENRTGHKLPTGYPNRRLWLHFVAKDPSGGIVFESGAVNSSAELPGDEVREVRPHLDIVRSPDEVVVWEAVLIDDKGVPTHRPLGAVEYGKDNRLLPIGFSRFHPQFDRMRTVNVGDDANHTAGEDTVTFEFAATTGLEIEVELLYQTLPPSVAAEHEEWPTPAGVRFAEMVLALPPLPVSIATVSSSLP